MRHDADQAIARKGIGTLSITEQVVIPTRPMHENPSPAATSSKSKAGANPTLQEDSNNGQRLYTSLMGIEELKGFEGCSHYSDQEATAILESLHSLSQILLDTFVFTPIISNAA